MNAKRDYVADTKFPFECVSFFVSRFPFFFKPKLDDKLNWLSWKLITVCFVNITAWWNVNRWEEFLGKKCLLWISHEYNDNFCFSFLLKKTLMKKQTNIQKPNIQKFQNSNGNWNVLFMNKWMKIDIETSRGKWRVKIMEYVNLQLMVSWVVYFLVTTTTPLRMDPA